MAAKHFAAGTFGLLVFAAYLPASLAICTDATSTYFQEGQPIEFTCTRTIDTAFINIYVDGNVAFGELGVCISAGCFALDANVLNISRNGDVVTAWLLQPNRNITTIYCEQNYQGSITLLETENCTTSFYKKPTVEECSGPIYSADGARADFMCTFDVYPDGICEYNVVQGEEGNFAQVDLDEYSVAMPNGGVLYTCTLKVTIDDALSGSYGFQLTLNSDVYGDGVLVDYTFPTYVLAGLTLEDPTEDNRVYDNPTAGLLQLSYRLLGNPGPNSTSIVLKYYLGDSYESFVGGYTTQYMQNNDTGGTLYLNITRGFRESSATYFEVDTANVLRGGGLRFNFTVGGTATSPPGPSTVAPGSGGNGSSTEPVSAGPSSTPDPIQGSTTPNPVQGSTTEDPVQGSTTESPISSSTTYAPIQNSTTAPNNTDDNNGQGNDDDHDDDDDGKDNGCTCHHTHWGTHGGHQPDHYHGPNGEVINYNNPAPVPGYYPGMGYGPYQGVGYGPWAYPNPRFGPMMYGGYPPVMNMGWYPYRGWFPWGG